MPYRRLTRQKRRSIASFMPLTLTQISDLLRPVQIDQDRKKPQEVPPPETPPPQEPSTKRQTEGEGE